MPWHIDFVGSRISSLNPSSLEGAFEESILEEQMNGCSAKHCYTNIKDVRMETGVYRIATENLKNIRDIQGTNVTLFIAADPKGNPYAG